VRARGLSDKNGQPASDRLEDIADAAEDAFGRLKMDQKLDEETAEAMLVRTLRKVAERTFSKRPMVDVVVMTV
jgi:ribonuclease J